MLPGQNVVNEAPLVWERVTPTTWVAKQETVSIALAECYDLFVVSDTQGDLLGMFSIFAAACHVVDNPPQVLPRTPRRHGIRKQFLARRPTRAA